MCKTMRSKKLTKATMLHLSHPSLTGWRRHRHKHPQSDGRNLFCHPCWQNSTVPRRILQKTIWRWAEPDVHTVNVATVLNNYHMISLEFAFREHSTKKEIPWCPDAAALTSVSKHLHQDSKVCSWANDAVMHDKKCPVSPLHMLSSVPGSAPFFLPGS